MNYQELNADEKQRLVMMILEELEEPITFDEFEETLGLLCEDIAGLECLSGDSFSALVIDCWDRHSI
jgi:hypothetical protein